MPAVPKESLGGRLSQLVVKSQNKIYKYNIFAVIVLEVLSMFLRESDKYVNYYYPLLSQLVLSVLVFTIYHKAKFLKYCTRKIWAYRFLMYYFVFGVVSIVLQLDNSTYTEIVGNGLLFITAGLTIYTLCDE